VVRTIHIRLDENGTPHVAAAVPTTFVESKRIEVLTAPVGFVPEQQILSRGVSELDVQRTGSP
jgi:hypothetical protein